MLGKPVCFAVFTFSVSWDGDSVTDILYKFFITITVLLAL